MYRLLASFAAFAILAGAAASNVASQPAQPNYGTKADIAYASKVWRALVANQLAGPDRLMAYPVKSDNPHGAFAQIVGGPISVAGRRTRVVVKNNHRGADLTAQKVHDEPQRYLADTAVMVKREAGYDPAHADWFWVVFKPDGRVLEFKGRAVAGRIDTGDSTGCIGCHVKKGGKDLEALTSR